MNTFSNLYWVCGHIGSANDSLTVFLNLHIDPSFRYEIVRNRMRCSKPGLLLNWAWYYPWWKQADQTTQYLKKQLYLNGQSRFAQAHFIMHEKELLSKFPDSKTITILVENEQYIDYYNCYAHYKLLDKMLYGSWYEIQKKNYPLYLKENQNFADYMFTQGMTALQYRSVAFQDWQGKIVYDCDDPIEEWHQFPYHNNFMENKKTFVANNQKWKLTGVAKKQHYVFIDKLVNPKTKQINTKYYLELCGLFELVPNLNLCQDFWQTWINCQPDISKYSPILSWKLTTKDKSCKLAIQ